MELEKNKCVLTLTDLLKMLECPVCLQTFDFERLLKCGNGHSGCQACFSKLTTCPVCRTVLNPKFKIISENIFSTINCELRHVESAKGEFNLKILPKLIKCKRYKICPTLSPTLQCVDGHFLCPYCDDKFNLCFSCKKARTTEHQEALYCKNFWA